MRMKLRHSAALTDERQCQDHGCLSEGQLRSQAQARRETRTIDLCAEYFGNIEVHLPNDLFLLSVDKWPS
jgi:hypothetical protein